MKSSTKGMWFLKGLKFALLGAAFVTVASFAVMLLWNWLVPSIFGWSTITWLQALGLLALSKILFGGRGWGGRRGGHHRHGQWRQKMEARWESMSDAEKAEMRSKWGKGCGHRGDWMPKDASQSEAG